MNKAKALTSLKELHQWSLNGFPYCWQDFVNIADLHYAEKWRDETGTAFNHQYYGYKEFVLFGQCLLIFENFGYEDVYNMIQEVIREYEEELVSNG